MAERRRHLLGTIGNRVALATVVVALGAVSVLGLLTFFSAQGDVSRLAQQEQHQASVALVAAAADGYRVSNAWWPGHLHAAARLAADDQASLVVLDRSGRAVRLPHVADSARPRVLEGAVYSYPIRVDGRRVGTAIVHFYRSALPTPETNLENALARTIALGGALGVLLALVVATVLSRWLTRPVAALTRAVGSMGRGDHSARVGDTQASGELAELAQAFDAMADTIEQEEELRRTVVADVAHELRTPLAIVQANTESLADGTTEATTQTLSSLHDEVLRLGRIVEDLDTIASAEAAVLRLRLQRRDLADVALRTVDVFRASFTLAGVELVVVMTPAPAWIDPGRAGQILGNLLTNALKFTRPGGTVSVRVTPDAGSGTAELVVADTGIGIPPDEVPFVFDRFWRGRQAGRVAGSGIGLAVVHALVLAHGGTVEVASEPEMGTRFTVRFPAAPVARDDTTRASGDRAGPPAPAAQSTDDALTAAATPHGG